MGWRSVITIINILSNIQRTTGIDWAHSPQFYHLQHTLKHVSVASILSLTQNGYSNKKVLNSEISLNLFLLKVESLFMSGFLGRLLAEKMLQL